MQAERIHTWCSIEDLGGGLAVRDDWEDEGSRPARRRHQRGRRGRRRRTEELDLEEEQVPLTPEERAYQQARLVADQKTKLTSELIWVSIIGIPLQHGTSMTTTVTLFIAQFLNISENLSMYISCWSNFGHPISTDRPFKKSR